MTNDQMNALTSGVKHKSDRMRILERNGVPRADIARFLGVRYQQVRNTLEGDKRTGYSPNLNESLSASCAVEQDVVSSSDSVHSVPLEADGSLRVGSELVTKAFGANFKALQVAIVHDGLFITTADAIVQRAITSLR